MMAILGIDMGSRRVGVAISESGVLATPHSVISNDGDEQQLVARLAALIEDLGVDVIILGIPRSLRRDAARTEEKFERLAAALRQKTCKEVVLWDEALTTVEASERLRAAGRTRRDLQAKIDMEAATIILQSYLDSRAGRLS